MSIQALDTAVSCTTRNTGVVRNEPTDSTEMTLGKSEKAILHLASALDSGLKASRKYFEGGATALK